MKLLKFLKRQFIILCSFLKGNAMILTFFLFPKMTYLFAPQTWLPKKDQRVKKETNPFDELILMNHLSDKLPDMDEINVVMGGVSFDRRQLMNLKGPKFLVNWEEKVDIPDVTYTTGDENWLRSFFEKNMLPALFVFVESKERIQKRGMLPITESYLKDERCKQIWCLSPLRGMASGVDTVVALEKYAKKINIYGWDQYMKAEPKGKNYYELYSILRKSTVVACHCSAIVGYLKTFNCAIRFKDVAKIKNHGYTAHIYKFPGLAKRLEEVFYV